MKYFCLLFLLLSLGCTEKTEIEPRDFNLVKTLMVTNITADGAQFNAKIVFGDKANVVNYGFVWSDTQDPTLANSDKVVYPDEANPTEFSATVTTLLKKDRRYFVRGFIETENSIIYGEVVEFVSLGSNAPIVTEARPLIGTVGDTVEIRGKGFSHIQQPNKVTFGEYSATVLIASDTLLKVLVPNADLESYQIGVTLVGNKATNTEPFITSSPIITNIQPKVAAIDDTISISGSDFSYTLTENVVKLSGVDARVIFADKSQIKFVIPNDLIGGVKSLLLEIGGKSANVNNGFDFKAPKVNSLDKTNGSFSEIITIRGENLSIRESNYKVVVRSIGVSNAPSVSCEIVAVSENEVSFIMSDEVYSSSTEVVLVIKDRVLVVGPFKIDTPKITGVSHDKFTDFNLSGVIEISGENFNAGKEKYDVWVDNVKFEVEQITDSKITIIPNRSLIPFKDNSVIKELDVKVRILDQFDTKEAAVSVEYYSKWLRMADIPPTGRSDSNFATLEIAGKGYIGPDVGRYNFLMFDPVTNKWERKADLPFDESFGSATFTIGTKGYYVGGVYGDEALQHVWQYDSELDTWSQLNDFPGKGTYRLFGLAISGKGYVGGGLSKRGYNQSGPFYTDFWEYNPDNDEWTAKKSMDFDGAELSQFTGVGLNGQGYIYSFNQGFIATYNKGSDSWVKKSTVPRMPSIDQGVRSLFAINSDVYVGLSRDRGSYGDTMYIFNTQTDSWSAEAVEGEVKRNNVRFFSISNQGYLIFGAVDRSNGFNINNTGNFMQYDPTR
ncbi:MAG: N-acetylneuraminic acid mutarotase [Bacteroidia bacterium]|jgi:N-acetylneuraminic acid mutarotase